ncbi:MAG TPA: efflux RND transporter permease subunit, partial [Actinomycetes bacterium]|nr:efflux RND transporter permease subunit [Actinomycetes bacterium]
LGSFAALLAVLAIAVRNGVLLVRHYQRLQEEGEELGAELVLRGARERVVPVVLSAATIAASLLPMLVLGNAPGLEVARPLAVVVLGGLVTSTEVGLLIVPVLYLRLAPRTQPSRAGAELRLSPV